MRKVLSLVPLAVAVLIALWFYNSSSGGSSYLGIPTVPCIDTTKPVVQDFSLRINMAAPGGNLPLDPYIGHDPANCLRSVYTNDSSGTVYVVSNYAEKYTLGDFFDTWHRSFVLTGVSVEGKAVNTGYGTLLADNESISVSYQ